MRLRLRKRNRSGAQDSKASGGCLILFGLVFGGMGTLFLVLMVQDFLRNAESQSWPEVPCMIESATISDDANSDTPFELHVRFRYEWEGKERVSERYGLDAETSDDYGELAAKRQALLSGPGQVCYVDPENPEAGAVLEQGSLLVGLLVFFPLIFVAIGVFVIIHGFKTLFQKKKAGMEAGDDSDREKAPFSISSAAVKEKSWVAPAMIVLFSVFTLVGSGILFPLVINPGLEWMDARDWEETPCEVIWSRVRTHTGDDSTTYSADIFFKYQFQGQEYRSNRVGFFSGSSSGYQGKADKVEQYSAGTRHSCYVDPGNPYRAVLERKLSAAMLFGLIPLIFLIIGVGGLVGCLMGVFKAKAAGGAGMRGSSVVSRAAPASTGFGRRGGAVFHQPELEEVEGEKAMKPGGSRVTTVLVMLFIGLFWNGIVSVFVWQLVEGFQHGRADWFLMLFLIPFVLIGLLVIFGFFYFLLAMFNPQPELRLKPGTLKLGEPAALAWVIHGNAGRIQKLRILLKGTESASYQRGTSRHTDSEIFYAAVLFEGNLSLEFRSGMATVTVPADLMHTLNLSNNKVKWEIEVEGHIPLWPDVRDTHEVNVLPAPVRHRTKGM